jgi:hypothetical protein
MDMNYAPNTVDWKRGDLVLHDADAKREDMLMRVLGYTSDGRCQTEYVEAEKRSRWGMGSKSRLINPLKVLHDPARFGVAPASAANENEQEQRP